MNILTNPNKLRGFERYVKVDKVSRRSILRGLGLAGGFVLAAPVMSRPGFAAYQTGADKMPHGTVVDPRVFENVGVDPEEWSGFAFGCGIERVAQLHYDFPDIRPLWEGDLRVLTQF